MRTQIFIAIAIFVVLLSYSLYLVFSNGNKKLGIIGNTLNKVNKVGNFFGKKNGNMDGEGGGETVNGTRTEPMGEDEEGKPLAEVLQDQMAYFDANDDENDDKSAATEPAAPSEP